MTDDRKLAAKLTADRLTEIEQELEAERSSAEPDWDRIEALSQEAAALFMQEEDVQDGKQALLSAIAQQQKPPARFFRWGLYASAAAVAGIAVFLVPAVIRMRRAVKPQPPAVQTETTASTYTAQSEESVTSDSLTGTQTETVPTDTDRTETEPAVTGTATGQSSVTQTALSTTTTVTTASTRTGITETAPTEPSSQQTEGTTAQQSQTSSAGTTDPYPFTGADYTTCSTGSDVTAPGPNLQTVYFRIVDEADPSQAVAGAELQLFDMKGNLVLSFLSQSSPVQAELALHTEYRLHAVSVPEGWQLPRRDMIFELNQLSVDITLRRTKEESP